MGDTRLVFLRVASDSADLWLESHVCAPPLLKRIVVVGGASEMLRRGVREGIRRARRKAWSAGTRIAASQLRFQPVCSSQGTDSMRSTTSNRRGGRVPGWHIHTFRAMWCCSGLIGATRGHSVARLLQSCFRRQCKPASAAVEAHRRLMGPTPSIPNPTCTPGSE